VNTLHRHGFDFWRQLFGELGWLDTRLQGWVYPTLSALLLASWVTPLGLAGPARHRVAAVALLAALGYCLAVFLIFFLVWTAIGANRVDGVQGRYFVAALPALALVPAALLRRGLPNTVQAAIAVAAAILSAGATVEAILRVDWKW